MTDRPRVSIVTVCRNAETCIDAAIRSVVSQTYGNIEYIIVDGLSTDKTLAIVDRYKDRIDKIISEKDGGIYDAMNKGIRQATGDVIYFLNADDRLHDDRVIEDIAREFENDHRLGLVVGQTRVMNMPAGHPVPGTNSFDTVYQKKRVAILRAVNHQRIFCRKWVFEKTGLFDLRYTLFADNDWFLKAVYKMRIPVKYIPRNAAFYNYRGKSRDAGYLRLAYEKWTMILRHSWKDFAVYLWDQTWVGFLDHFHRLRKKSPDKPGGSVMKDLRPFVSIVIPVKNGGKDLQNCLGSIKCLDYPKDRLEVIIADGMSADDTKEVSSRYGATVVPNEKQIEISGRLRGFQASRGEFVASTDADCTFDVEWIKNSLKYFEDASVGAVGGLTLLPDDASSFERAVNYIFRVAEFFRSTCHRQGPISPRMVEDLPGCNTIYRREALLKIMPLDEDLLASEDVFMNYRVRKSGYKLMFAPEVKVWHHRRSSPKTFFKQIYRWAIARIQLARKDMKLLGSFHLAVGLSLPFLVLTAVAACWFGAIGMFVGWMVGFSVFLFLMAVLQLRSLSAARDVLLAGLIFVVAWSAGFLEELITPIRDVKGK